MPSIDHKTILVTGGAHRIGGHISSRLAEEGWSVAIHCNKSVDQANELARTIISQGGNAAAFSADLSSSESLSGLMSRVVDELGPVGALINNASIFEAEQWNDVSLNSWAAHLDVNLRAPFFLSQAFAQQMPRNSFGAIINIIDQRVWNLTPGFISYTVSKSGLWTLTQTLAMALAPQIRVNGIGPGPTLANKRQDKKAFIRQSESMPLKHRVLPSDISDTVIYLLDTTSVTGQMIAVDSGEHLGWTQASQIW